MIEAKLCSGASGWLQSLRSKQFTEDTVQSSKVKTISPVPEVGNYPIRLRRAHFPPAKGCARGGDCLPNQELPQQPDMVDGAATATVTATVPTQGHSDPRSP